MFALEFSALLDGLSIQVALEEKLAGILAESATLKDRPLWVVVGIGINLNSGDFSPELSEAATSLKKISGRTVDVSETASALIENFERAYRGFIDVARN